MTRTETLWIEDEKMILTRINGLATMADVESWEHSLNEALDKIDDGGVFKIMVDLYGFKAVNFDVHKRFRVIVPKTLAAYGWRVGYLDMFPEAQVELKNTRGITCVAAVHVHDDESKITNYDKNYSRVNERFFTSTDAAMNWIGNFKIS